MKHWPAELASIILAFLAHGLPNFAFRLARTSPTFSLTSSMFWKTVFLATTRASVLLASIHPCTLVITQKTDWETIFAFSLSTTKTISSLRICKGVACPPDWATHFLNLESLCFEGKNGARLSDLVHFERLSHLQLGPETIHKPEELTALENFQFLHTVEIEPENKIHSRGLSHLCRVPHLRTLLVSTKNGLVEEDFNLFSCPCLERLTIGRAIFGRNGALGLGINLQFITSFVHLVSLEVKQENLAAGDLELVALSSLERLRRLVIGGDNCVGVDGARAISSIATLQHLEIGPCNALCAAGARYLAQLPILAYLKIGFYNRLGPEGALHLSTIKSLTSLEIGASNNIGEEGVQSLTALEHLSSLTIGMDNAVGLRGARHLSNMPNLAVLKIGMFNTIGQKGTECLIACPTLVSLQIGRFNHIYWKKVGGLKKSSRLHNRLEYDDSLFFGRLFPCLAICCFKLLFFLLAPFGVFVHGLLFQPHPSPAAWNAYDMYSYTKFTLVEFLSISNVAGTMPFVENVSAAMLPSYFQLSRFVFWGLVVHLMLEALFFLFFFRFKNGNLKWLWCASYACLFCVVVVFVTRACEYIKADVMDEVDATCTFDTTIVLHSLLGAFSGIYTWLQLFVWNSDDRVCFHVFMNNIPNNKLTLSIENGCLTRNK